MGRERRPAAGEGPVGSLRDGWGRLGARCLDSLRWWGRCADVLGQAARRPDDFGGMWRRGVAFARRETSAALEEQLRLQLDHYVAVVDAGIGVANRMLQAIVFPDVRATIGGAAAGKEAQPAAPDGMSRRGRLVFAEEFGRAARRSFAVSNRTEERRLVRFEISEFVREGGQERFRVPIDFTPAEFPLEPGQQRIVQAELALGDPFTPGHTHFAMVRVLGFPGMELAVVAAPRPREEQAAAPRLAQGPAPSGETGP